MDGEASSIAVLFFHRGVIPFGSPLATVQEQDNPSASCMRCRGSRVLAFPSVVRLSTTENWQQPLNICTHRPMNSAKEGGIPLGRPFATNKEWIHKTNLMPSSHLFEASNFSIVSNGVLRLAECAACSIEYSLDGT